MASSTPPAVPPLKAMTPNSRMDKVSILRKASAVAVAPTLMPRKMVTMLISSFWAVLLRRSTTPHSRNRLPSISRPIKGAAEGRSRETKMVTTMGNTIFSAWETGRSCFMTMQRSSLVVRARMMGGWITGTRAI